MNEIHSLYKGPCKYPINNDPTAANLDNCKEFRSVFIAVNVESAHHLTFYERENYKNCLAPYQSKKTK